MIDEANKKKVFLAVVPLYMVVWLIVTACSTGLNGSASGIPFTTGRSAHDAAAGKAGGFGVDDTNGDFVFEGELEGPLPNKQRTTVITTVFGFPVRIPESRVEFNGVFNPFRTAGDALKRPKKVDVVVEHIDDEDKTVAKDTHRLKIKGDNIVKKTLMTSQMDAGVGHTIAVTVKPKGGDFDLSETLQLFWDMDTVATRRGLASYIADLAMAAEAGWILAESALRAKPFTLFTTTFGVPAELPATEWFIEQAGNAAPPVGDASRLAPKKVKVILEHLDTDGAVVDSHSFTVPFQGGSVVPGFSTNFKGFSLDAGESVRVKLQAKGGNFLDTDVFDLNLTLF